jgi:hypothetical protein
MITVLMTSAGRQPVRGIKEMMEKIIFMTSASKTSLKGGIKERTER